MNYLQKMNNRQRASHPRQDSDDNKRTEWEKRGSAGRCVVPQSLFGKRVSVERHAVGTQRISPLNKKQNRVFLLFGTKEKIHSNVTNF